MQATPSEWGPIAILSEILVPPPPPSRTIPMELASASPDAKISDTRPCCKHCDRPFKPRHERGRPRLHCSDACRLAYRKATGAEALAAWKWRHTEAGRESRRLSKRRKKVGRDGGKPRDASFDRLAIFARDDWRCQLCGAKVQQEQPASTDSATIRLLVPVQLEGKYSLENCETACRKCNGRAAALVAMALADPSFRLPRSIRVHKATDYDAPPQVGPQRTSRESFGSVPPTSQGGEPVLVPMSRQRPQGNA